jgi:hypothetical protein
VGLVALTMARGTDHGMEPEVGLRPAPKPLLAHRTMETMCEPGGVVCGRSNAERAEARVGVEPAVTASEASTLMARVWLPADLELSIFGANAFTPTAPHETCSSQG